MTCENSPLVSCVVTAYNSEDYVAEALDSVLGQTYGPLEVIVVDDGSTDRTGEIVRGYGDRIVRLAAEDVGPPAARNLGWEATSGELVAFLDADDLWSREKIAEQVESFATIPDLDACVTKVRPFWIFELADEAERYRDHPRAQALPGYVASSVMFRRSLRGLVGPFDENLHGCDFPEWFLRPAAKDLKIHTIDRDLVHRRFHHQNITRRKADQFRGEYLRLIKLHLTRTGRGQASTPRPTEG